MLERATRGGVGFENGKGRKGGGVGDSVGGESADRHGEEGGRGFRYREGRGRECRGRGGLNKRDRRGRGMTW